MNEIFLRYFKKLWIMATSAFVDKMYQILLILYSMCIFELT